MKIIIPGPLKDNINNLMRTAGYHFQRQEQKTALLNILLYVLALVFLVSIFMRKSKIII